MKINEPRRLTKYKVFTGIMTLLLVTSIGLSACGKEEPPCAEKESPTEIVLGALLPLTGDLSSSGETASAALEIAVNDINEYLSDIGYEKRVRLIVEDTGTDPNISL